MHSALQYVARSLQHKHLSNSTGAVAGFISSISLIVGAIAAHLAPLGWRRVSMALHFSKKPLLLKLAPYLAGLAVAIAVAAGLIRFYSWLMEREVDQAKLPE
jgi:hypothetical protein